MLGFSSKYLHVGAKIARRYEVLEVLGKGGMGYLLKVADHLLDRETIAIRLLYPHLTSDPQVLERFQQQVLVTRQMSHPHIVQLYDYDSVDGDHHFISMEYVYGSGLDALLPTGRNAALPFDEASTLLLSISSALAYAQSKGILHGDLKPSNILVSADGTVKISDFGLAKSFESNLGLTATGVVVGTPAFMSPEQFSGGKLNERSDIYAFGILAYRLAVGRVPFTGKDYLELAQEHIHEPLPAFGEHESTVPAWFQELIGSCCAKDPSKRPATAEEIHKVIAGHIRPEMISGSQKFSYSFLEKAAFRKPDTRPRTTALSIGGIILAILIGALVQTQSRRGFGSILLQLESVSGVRLTYLKQLFNITVSLDRPLEYFQMVTTEEWRYALHALAAAGADLTITDKDGNNLVHYATANKQLDILHSLSSLGVSLNVANNKGETPLLWAIRLRRTQAAEKLLRLRASPNVCDYSRNCPAHIIAEQHLTDLLRVFAKSGANVHQRNAQGVTAFHILVRNRDMEGLEALADLKEYVYPDDLDARDFQGRTPLMYAAADVSNPLTTKAIIRILKDLGARTSARDNEGRTALIHAVSNKNAPAALALIQAGASLEERDASGVSALELARNLGLDSVLPTPPGAEKHQ